MRGSGSTTALDLETVNSLERRERESLRTHPSPATSYTPCSSASSRSRLNASTALMTTSRCSSPGAASPCDRASACAVRTAFLIWRPLSDECAARESR